MTSRVRFEVWWLDLIRGSSVLHRSQFCPVGDSDVSPLLGVRGPSEGPNGSPIWVLEDDLRPRFLSKIMTPSGFTRRLTVWVVVMGR